jgi:hypothetical protein
MAEQRSDAAGAEGVLRYFDGIAAARTLIALGANAAAIQRRLPEGWEVAPYAGDEWRGKSLTGANLLLPFHEVFAVRSHSGKPDGMGRLSYLPFISQARNRSTGALGHFHWLLYTEDPAGIPVKYRDAKLARITRSQTFTKEARGETHAREIFSAIAESGEVQLSLAYRQDGVVMWVTADKPNQPLYFDRPRVPGGSSDQHRSQRSDEREGSLRNGPEGNGGGDGRVRRNRASRRRSDPATVYATGQRIVNRVD